MDFLNSIMSGSARNYIIYMGLFMVVYMIGLAMYMKKKKASQNDWHRLNPTAAKVYVVSTSSLIKSKGLYIHSVDDENPHTFVEMNKTGFFVLPGPHIVESSFTTSRPGLLHKQVSRTWGPSKQEIEVEAGKNYSYSFDDDKECYIFTEIQ